MTPLQATNTRALFIDIDGIIADISHRLKYIEGAKGERDYDKFYGACMAKDAPMEQNIAWIAGLARYSGTVAFITGRPERTRELTRLWIKEHALDIILKNFNDDPEHPPINIFMRADGDHRPSPEVKAELVREAYKQHLEHWVETDDTTVLILDDDFNNLARMQDSLLALENSPRVSTMMVGLRNLF